MHLSKLLKNLSPLKIAGNKDIEVGEIREDSRAVKLGDVFVAVRGATVDGHDYIEEVCRRGASAIVVETPQDTSTTQIVVTDSSIALGRLAAARLEYPARHMTMIGITGTNGKTTTAYITESILKAAGLSPGVIGTVNYRWQGTTYPALYSTPPATVLQRTLKDMLKAQTTHCVTEVSSAALASRRTEGASYDIACFTNLTQDHLDFHSDIDSYLAAKALLFSDYLGHNGTAVVNIDDPYSEAIIRAAGNRSIVTVSRKKEAFVWVRESTSGIDGITCVLQTSSGQISITNSVLIGHYNIANIAMAVAIAETLGLPFEAIQKGIAELPAVPGRVEKVASDDTGVGVIVDYAHTPDAVQNVLAAVREVTKGRLVCILGCGGDRDTSKRPLMGEAAANNADHVVVTSDNPRTENPQDIIDQILPAVPTPLFVETNRQSAIEKTIDWARPGDVVVIAGKGHEDYQIIGTKKYPFDDRKVAAEALDQKIRYSTQEIVRATSAQTTQTDDSPIFWNIGIDSRTVQKGDLYVAIRGDRFDGHDFVDQAHLAGAAGVMVDNQMADCPIPQFIVTDTRKALGQLANLCRKKWGKSSVIAITGSSGKTTTKGLITAALSGSGCVHSTQGSLNNETGVPLTLLGLRPWHDYAVIEMGMRSVGDIRYLTQFAEPNIRIVLNAGTAHAGIAGGPKAIVRGKSEMYADKELADVSIYPSNDSRLQKAATKKVGKTLSFGEEDTADVRVVSYQARGTTEGTASSIVNLVIKDHDYNLTWRMFGIHNATNAACAIAAAMAVGVSPKAAIAGLENAEPSPMRGQIKSIAGRNIVVDCYNANPESTKASLLAVKQLSPSSNMYALLGDMLELGESTQQEHRNIGSIAGNLGYHLIACGNQAATIVSGHQNTMKQKTVATSPYNAAIQLENWTNPGD